MTSQTKDLKDSSICVLGLGYVGLPLAALFAHIGFKVLAVEIRDEVLEKLSKGKPHFFEPGLADLLKQSLKQGNLSFSKCIPANYQADVYIITVGTPLDVNGRVRLDMIENVSQEICQCLKENNLVVLRSTVKVGTTRKIVKPILDKAKVSFDLAFCPERILEGQAIEELRRLPQIVGGVNLKSSIRAAQLFQFLTPTVVRVSNTETAEMIKLIDNASRDVSFAFSNEIARVADALAVSAEEVIKAGKLGYPRTNLPMPGPVGGPCLTKDSYILSESLEGFGITAEMIMQARKINERQPKEVTNYLKGLVQTLAGFPQKPIISLLGIAFKGKPAIDDLRGTMAQPIFQELKEHFPEAVFRAYDPVVAKEEIRQLGLEPVLSIEEAMRGAHLVLILNNHPVFSQMPLEELAKNLAKPSLIYDFWNNFIDRALHLPEGRGYMALGSHIKAILPRKC